MSRAEIDRPTFPPGQFQAREMSDLYGFDAVNSLWRRVVVNAAGELIVAGGGGGGGVGITDTDDNSIAASQTTLLAIDENYVFDAIAGVWIRQQGGVDNSPGVANPQVSFTGGIVRGTLPVYADGDVSSLNFDTSGRLLVDAEGITDTDDNAVASGQVTGLSIPINYVFDGTNWIRWQGGIDGDDAPVSPQGGFVGGIVTDPLDSFLDGEVSLLHFDTSGRLHTTGTVSGDPGTVIGPTAADIAIPVGPPVPLPAAPAGTRRVTVQNTGPAGTFVRVKEVGAPVGAGFILPRFSSYTFGGADGAVAAVEAEETIAGIATSVSQIFEG